MNIYGTGFAPTYLYIKRHKITDLLYFGKTSRNLKWLLENYSGSGRYWKNHLKHHGKEHVETIWFCLFVDADELVKFAKMCSYQWNIVNAVDSSGKKIWANEQIENGLDGNPKGHKFGPMSDEQKKIRSGRLLGVPKSELTRKKMSESKKRNCNRLGKPHSIEAKLKMANAATGKIHSEETKQKMRDSHARRKAAKKAALL